MDRYWRGFADAIILILILVFMFAMWLSPVLVPAIKNFCQGN